MTYQFTVPGPPVPKARHRTAADGHTYNTDVTNDQELLVQSLFIEAYGKPEYNELGVPQFDKKAYFKVGLWFYTRNRTKMDIDNLVKLVLDALNDLAWKDDSRVWDLEAHRRVDQENPRTEVTITYLT